MFFEVFMLLVRHHYASIFQPLALSKLVYEDIQYIQTKEFSHRYVVASKLYVCNNMRLIKQFEDEVRRLLFVCCDLHAAATADCY